MSRAGTWVVSFADVQVAVNWRGSASLEILELLFRDTGDETGNYPSQAQFHLHADAAGDSISLSFKGDVMYEGADLGAAAGSLLDWMVYALAYDCRLGPLFHAAGVSFRGKGLLVPGQSGSGKTTVAAWLASQGHHALSDELVCVEEGTRLIRAFPRPFHLRDPSIPALENLTDFSTAASDVHGQTSWQTERGWLVPTAVLNPRNALSAPEVRLILFPRYQSGANLQVERLSPAQTAMRLMECLINARNLVGHGFAEVARIAHHIEAYAVTYSALDPIQAQIDSLIDES